MKRLIVTADDFGVSEAVNLAVETAHRDGILTAASLMVAGGAVDDAVARARRLPRLGVGLHLVLVDGRPVLPPSQIPGLVDGGGMFRTNMVLAGVAFALRPEVRRQLAAEIEAQFSAFAATGLALDHVNAHKHFHLHPTIAALILEIGVRYGVRAVRAPIEPKDVLDKVEPVSFGASQWIAAFWAQRLRGRFANAGLVVPDHVFGLAWSGAMGLHRLTGLIRHLPPGLSEIYLHPGTDDRFPGHAPGYAYRAELAGLIDVGTRDAVRMSGANLGRFADFAGEVGSA